MIFFPLDDFVSSRRLPFFSIISFPRDDFFSSRQFFLSLLLVIFGLNNDKAIISFHDFLSSILTTQPCSSPAEYSPPPPSDKSGAFRPSSTRVRFIDRYLHPPSLSPPLGMVSHFFPLHPWFQSPFPPPRTFTTACVVGCLYPPSV